MASIQTRIGSTGVESHRVGYYAAGKFRFTPSLASLEGAEKIKAIIEDKRQGPEVALKLLRVAQDNDGMTLGKWFARHVERRLALRMVTDGTAAGYENEANRTWLPRLGEYPLKSIDRKTVEEWVIWQSQQHTSRSIKQREKAKAAGTKPLPRLEPISPKTVRNAHSLLSSVLDSAADEGLIDRNPAKGVPVPEDGIRDEKDIFTRDEWTRFHDAMQDEYKAFTSFLLVTGCRIGEASAVQVRDLDVQNRAIHIVRAWKKGRNGQVLGVPKSSRSRRVVMLPDWAVAEFAAQAEGKAASDLLFTAPRGGRIHGHRYGERQWTDALERAGITKHLTPHSARHTFASWALMDGVATQVVQHRLGHQNIATTSTIYGHLLMDAQADAVDSIGWKPTKQLEA